MTDQFQIKFLYSGISFRDLPQSHIPECVLVGRSNVGKSSLLNFLAGQKKLAYVSQTPGRTKTINIFSANHDAFYIADLPGYGFSKTQKSLRSKWSEAIQEYFEKRKNIVGIFFLVDVRREITKEDRDLIFWFKTLGFKIIVVQTKCDKVSKAFLLKQKNIQAEGLSLNTDDIISISVHKKIGLQTLCNQFINMVKPFSIKKTPPLSK